MPLEFSLDIAAIGSDAQRFAATMQKVLIGSHDDCNIILPDVPAKLAQIDQENNRVWLTPLAETPVIMLDGQPITERTALGDGDRFVIGFVSMTVWISYRTGATAFSEIDD